MNSFFNTAVVTCFSVAAISILSAMMGFILQRRFSRLTRTIHFLIIAGLIVPPAIVPLFWILKTLRLNSTFLGVILIYTAVGIPFSTVLYRGFFGTVPRELDEAAFIEGCGSLKMFAMVALPLLKPVTMTVIVTQFMTIWNDFNISLYFLNSPKRFTLTTTVYFFFGQFGNYWNLVFADVVIIAVPVAIVYAAAQKYIISGMTAGALKG